MSEEEISETLNRVVPHRDVPEGMLAGARRRRRRTRALTGGAAVAVVVALAVPLGLTMGGSAQQVATPAPTTSSTSTSRHESDGVLCPPGRTSPGATLGDMTRGYACGPVGFPFQDSNESVQIPLSDDLIAAIVQAARASQRPVEELSSRRDGPYFQFPDNVQSLVLLGPDGTSVTMTGTPDGYSWYAPEHMQFEPSWQLADRIWEEIGQDDNCSVPGYLYPPDVTVDVYDAGGGKASVERVTQHLAQAGFLVTNTQQYLAPNMGTPIIIRSRNENLGAGLVISNFVNVGGEMSREDNVVDVLVTKLFNDETDPFTSDPWKRVTDGFLRCTSPSGSAEPSTSTAPTTVLPPTRPSNATEPHNAQSPTQEMLTCPEKAATDSYLVEIPESTVPVDELTASLVPDARTPATATLCRYLAGGEHEATLEGTKDLANPADLARLANLPAAGNQSGTCTVPGDDVHYYLLRLDYGAAGGSWVTIGANNTGGGCVHARNGHFVTDAELGEDADTAWADGSWPAN